MGGAIPGNIPFLTVVKWCEVYGLGHDMMIFYDRCFCAMDGTYRDWYLEKQESTSSEGKK